MPGLDLDVIRQLQDLVGVRAAYPLIAMLLTCVVQLARKSPKTADWWKKVPDGWRWLIPVAAGAAMGFVHGYQGHLPLGGALLSAGIEALYGIFGVSMTSMGLAAALRESPVLWDGGVGGKRPVTIVRVVNGHTTMDQWLPDEETPADPALKRQSETGSVPEEKS